MRPLGKFTSTKGLPTKPWTESFVPGTKFVNFRVWSAREWIGDDKERGEHHGEERCRRHLWRVVLLGVWVRPELWRRRVRTYFHEDHSLILQDVCTIVKGQRS